MKRIREGVTPTPLFLARFVRVAPRTSERTQVADVCGYLPHCWIACERGGPRVLIWRSPTAGRHFGYAIWGRNLGDTPVRNCYFMKMDWRYRENPTVHDVQENCDDGSYSH